MREMVAAERVARSRRTPPTPPTSHDLAALRRQLDDVLRVLEHRLVGSASAGVSPTQEAARAEVLALLGDVEPLTHDELLAIEARWR